MPRTGFLYYSERAGNEHDVDSHLIQSADSAEMPIKRPTLLNTTALAVLLVVAPGCRPSGQADRSANMATKHRRIRGGDSEPAVSPRDSRARLRHRREWQDHRNHRIRCRARLRKPSICHLDSAADRFGHQDRHSRRCTAARRGRQTRPRRDRRADMLQASGCQTTCSSGIC